MATWRHEFFKQVRAPELFSSLRSSASSPGSSCSSASIMAAASIRAAAKSIYGPDEWYGQVPHTCRQVPRAPGVLHFLTAVGLAARKSRRARAATMAAITAFRVRERMLKIWRQCTSGEGANSDLLASLDEAGLKPPLALEHADNGGQ